MNYELCNDTPMFEVGTFIQTSFRDEVIQGKCIGWRRGTACIEVKFDAWDPLDTSPRMLVVPQQMVDFVPDWRDTRIAELEAQVKALTVKVNAAEKLKEAVASVAFNNPFTAEYLTKRGGHWTETVKRMQETSESDWHYLRRLDFEVCETAWGEYLEALRAGEGGTAP